MTNRVANQIKTMLLEGKRYKEIMDATGAANSTVAFHARRLGQSKFSFTRKIYDWAAIQSFYDDGHTIVEITDKFGPNRSSIIEAAQRGAFVLADHRDPVRIKALAQHKRKSRGLAPETVLVKDSEYSTKVIREIISRHNLLPYMCDTIFCLLHIENPLWYDAPLVLHLDHKNGIRNDHRLENLRWLCPNCHSMTDTYCGRNKIGQNNTLLTTIRESVIENKCEYRQDGKAVGF